MGEPVALTITTLIVLVCVLASVLSTWLTLVALLQSTKALAEQVAEHNRLIEALGDAWKQMADSIRETVDKQAGSVSVASTPKNAASALSPRDEDVSTTRPATENCPEEITKVIVDVSDIVAATIELDARQPF